MRRRYLESHSKSLKPNVVAFTAVLNACARPVGAERDDAFEIAQLTMEELHLGTFGKPNFLSYAAFLSVCSSALAPGQRRDEIVKTTFEQCKTAGQVAQIVLEKLYGAASPTLYDELVGKYIDETGYPQVPETWTASIKGERSGGAEDLQGSYNAHMIPRASKVRLQSVLTHGGQSGLYSGRAPLRTESEGISWSQSPLGSAE